MINPLNHLAFFEVLAEDSEEGSPEWLATAAGLLVLRLYEGVAEEQTAALLGLPRQRIEAICSRATETLLQRTRETAPRVLGAKAVAR